MKIDPSLFGRRVRVTYVADTEGGRETDAQGTARRPAATASPDTEMVLLISDELKAGLPLTADQIVSCELVPRPATVANHPGGTATYFA